MELYMPTHVYASKDCVKQHGSVFNGYGQRALIITGRHSSKMNGSLQDVCTELEKQDIAYQIFDAIEENPSIETVMKATEAGIAFQTDFVIGIGGGSPMDAAKAIALMIANPSLGPDVLFQPLALSYLPVIEVPTTAGTGSEVTPWSILTIHKQRTKSSIGHKIYPAAALLDAGYLQYASRKVLLSTAIDTLCHLVESHLVTKSTAFTKIYSEKGLRLWGEFKDALKNNMIEVADYEKMMQASMLGGMAITHTGTGFPHALSYKITYETGLAHGFACGLTLAGFVAHYYDEKLREEVLDLLGFEDAAALGIYLNQLIGETDFTESIWQDTVKALFDNPGKLATYPVGITMNEVLSYV